MDVTKPYEFIGFGAMDVTKPYEFIRFGATSGPHETLDSTRAGVQLDLHQAQLLGLKQVSCINPDC